jgi:hypothetical protein
LMALYRHAPAVGGIGGWSGFTLTQICARLSGQSESFWSHHTIECEEMVDSRLQSFLITGQTLLYFFLLFHSFRWIMATLVCGLGAGLRMAWLGYTTTVVDQSQTAALHPPHAIVYYAGLPGAPGDICTSGGHYGPSRRSAALIC